MDVVSASPSKKYKIDNIDIPMIECKRQFNLPHKFPSMVKPGSCNYVFKIHKMANSNKTGASSNLMDSKNRKTSALNNIKKLRLKARDGKVLGEVKVQFLAPNDGSKMTGNKQIVNHKNDSPMKLSIVEPNELLNSLGSKHDVAGQLVLKSVSSTDLSAVIKNKPTEVPDKHKKLFQKHHFLNEADEAIQEKKVLMVEKNEHKHNIKALPKNGKLKKNNVSLANDKKEKNLIIKKKYITHKEKVQTETESSNAKIFNSTKHWHLVKSKFPVVRCEKLTVFKNKVNINEINSKNQSSNSNIKAVVTKGSIKRNINLYCTKPSDNKKDNLSISVKEVKSVQKKPGNIIDNEIDDSLIIVCDESVNTNKDSNSEQGEFHNSSLLSSKITDKKTENVYNQMSNKLIVCQNKVTCNSGNIQNRESSSENNSDTNQSQKTVGNIVREDKLLEHWNVIKEALISVTDEELRAKALQALTECGIGIAKQVPIIPPKQLRTVHDSQIQTDVFGLLDTKSFVLVNKDILTIERIQQTERSTPAVYLETEVQTEPQAIIKMKQKAQHIIELTNPIDNIDVLPKCSSYSLENIFDIDNFFNENYTNNTIVNEVKQVLSEPPSSLYKNAVLQLERDYKGMQNFDENGMLNIHRAVANNQFQEVQRLLLVLQASKTDIDVLTENGMTSLELAIQLDSSESIVNVLLEAGAKPVFPELLHESAIILASKMSSSLLPNLLNYVKNNKLLNQADSYGFAPLHYCTLKNNINGVEALIKAGADINLRDSRSGRTSLFHAIENNCADIAHILVQNNAAVNVLNYSGQSTLNLVHMTF